MFLYGPEYENQDLGFDPFGAILTGAALKDVFGIGRKKAMQKEIDANYKGLHTSQFPPNVDWQEFINRPKRASFRGQFMSIKQHYDLQRKRKDSGTLDAKIATPEDAGAYTVLSEIRKGIHCGEPGANKPGHRHYKNCPIFKDSKTNIFDKPARDAWLAKQQAVKAQPKVAPAPPAPKPVVKAAPARS